MKAKAEWFMQMYPLVGFPVGLAKYEYSYALSNEGLRYLAQKTSLILQF